MRQFRRILTKRISHFHNMTDCSPKIFNGKIVLHEKEARLFGILQECLKWKASQDNTGGWDATVMRVAGGWVRDKILNRDSHDIDIALNNKFGEVFAEAVNEYLKANGQETRTIAVIQANPDQSKHLQTANLRVLDLEIDCVNLRAETYTDESRIPDTSFGTPTQDAERRDFTINSLFYNINTGEVEDFTGCGLRDTAEGIIRTPISAFITFKDDPLRVLRAIRFSSRLNFSLCPELVAAASSPEIVSALLHKVSRERIYKELDGMLNTTSSRPLLAFGLMYRLNLLDAVFTVPQVKQSNSSDPPVPPIPSIPEFPAHWQETAMETLTWVNALLTMKQTGQLHAIANNTAAATATAATTNTVVVTAEAQSIPKHSIGSTEKLEGHHKKDHSEDRSKLLFLSAVMVPLRGLGVTEKKKITPLTTVVLRDGLKMETHSLISIQTMVDSMDSFVQLASSDLVNVDINIVGKLLRTCKELWEDTLTLACAFTIAQQGTFNTTAAAQTHTTTGDASATGIFRDIVLSPETLAVVCRFSALRAAIEATGLVKPAAPVWNLKPLLNGSELMRLLALPKGPMIGSVAEEQLCWMIRNTGTNKSSEDCLVHLRGFVDKLLEQQHQQR